MLIFNSFLLLLLWLKGGKKQSKEWTYFTQLFIYSITVNRHWFCISVILNRSNTDLAGQKFVLAATKTLHSHHFSIVEGSGDSSSIFFYSLWFRQTPSTAIAIIVMVNVSMMPKYFLFTFKRVQAVHKMFSHHIREHCEQQMGSKHSGTLHARKHILPVQLQTGATSTKMQSRCSLTCV